MPKWIDEVALSMSAPWRLVISYIIRTAGGTGFQGTIDHCVRIVAKQLDSDGSGTDLLWAVPAVSGRLGKEERRALDL
jgi:hypothetical protein